MSLSDSVALRRWCFAFRVGAVAAATLVFIFLAWRSSPWFSELGWMPSMLAHWADRHGVARNTLGFFGFGVLAFACAGRRWPQIVAASLFACGLEIGQLWIPSRTFDLNDIYASLLGLLLGWIVVAASARILRGFFRPC